MDSGCHKLSENIRFCGLRGHIVEIRRDVTLEDDDEQRRNVKIELEFWEAEFAIKQDCFQSHCDCGILQFYFCRHRFSLFLTDSSSDVSDGKLLVEVGRFQ